MFRKNCFDIYSHDIMARCVCFFTEKVFAGGVPRCDDENCNAVVKPGELYFQLE